MTRRFWFAVAALFLWGVLGMTPTPAKSATLAGSVAVSLPLGTSRADYSTVPCAIDTQSLTAENAIGNCSLGGLGAFIGEPNPSHRNTIAEVVHSVSPELRATQLDGNTVPPGPNAEYADTIAALSNASAPGVPKPLGAETAIGLVLLGNETPAGLALAARAQFWVARIICVKGKDDGCLSWAAWAVDQYYKEPGFTTQRELSRIISICKMEAPMLATNIARRMVTQFGMSDKIGAIAVGDREQEIFLGREFAQRREISEQTSQVVDAEVKRIIDAAYAKAREILADNRDLLDRMAAALLERETIDRDEIELLVKGELLPPRSTVPLALPAAPAGPPPAGKSSAAAPLGVPNEAPSPA